MDHIGLRFAPILLQSRKSNDAENLANVDFLANSATAVFRSANTKLRDRFCARRCGPSYRRARNASAVLKNFGRHPKKTLATMSANSCRSRTSGANLKAFLVRDSQLSKASLSFRGHRNSRQRASTTTVRTTRSQNVVAWHGKSWPVVPGEGFAPDLGVVLRPPK
jgi:hypothetical protein